jgi:2-methylcitrate dehydratase PrpD
MAFGARVPGTSCVLDPVQAAFNLGVMFVWPDHTGDATEPVIKLGRAAAFAGVVAVADFVARQAIAEARPPLTWQDVLTRLAQARAIQQRLAPAAAGTGAVVDHALAVRVASAAAVAAMLGGTTAHVAHAATYAWIEGDERAAGVPAAVASARAVWVLAEAASRGVRLAWLALATQPGAAFSGLPELAVVLEVIGGRHDDEPAPAAPVAARIRERFEACVVQHFPAAQAGRIKALYGDPEALAEKPFNECVSALVRN